MAIATSGNGLELLHTKPVTRVVFMAVWVFVAVALYTNCHIGLEAVGRTPSVQIPLTLVTAGMGLLPLVCGSARTFAVAMQWCFPCYCLCFQAALFFEWAATGNAFMFWWWSTIFLSSVFLLTFRRRYFLVGYVVLFFLGCAVEVPLLCAMDSKDSTQFLFAYDTYAECILLGYFQSLPVVGSVGGFVLFLVVQKIANYLRALRAATSSRDAHRLPPPPLPPCIFPSLHLSLSLSLSVPPSHPFPVFRPSKARKLHKGAKCRHYVPRCTPVFLSLHGRARCF